MHHGNNLHEKTSHRSNNQWKRTFRNVIHTVQYGNGHNTANNDLPSPFSYFIGQTQTRKRRPRKQQANQISRYPEWNITQSKYGYRQRNIGTFIHLFLYTVTHILYYTKDVTHPLHNPDLQSNNAKTIPHMKSLCQPLRKPYHTEREKIAEGDDEDHIQLAIPDMYTHPSSTSDENPKIQKINNASSMRWQSTALDGLKLQNIYVGCPSSATILWLTLQSRPSDSLRHISKWRRQPQQRKSDDNLHQPQSVTGHRSPDP